MDGSAEMYGNNDSTSPTSPDTDDRFDGSIDFVNDGYHLYDTILMKSQILKIVCRSAV